MATGQELETRSHVVGFREEITKVGDSSEDAFFTWFDAARDKNAAFVRGSWDFALHIATPAARHLSSPEEKIALEIGHGGGRLLAAASRAFGQVIGVDIHDNNTLVEEELRARGIQNFRLIQADGSKIPVDDASIDFVYSFIVLQHVERYEVFKTYLAEASRILKPGGVAVIYFGRKWLLSLNRTSTTFYWLDRFLERFLLPKGFSELPARVNETNLLVALHHAQKLASDYRFDVHERLVSHKAVPDGVAKYGGQNGLVMIKQAVYTGERTGS
jgi:ubiquinone/menaquinone biosynthesis C-methylase UbiE